MAGGEGSSARMLTRPCLGLLPAMAILPREPSLPDLPPLLKCPNLIFEFHQDSDPLFWVMF